ncbi:MULTISPECIES: glycine betaine ABC transporter substrate-binding protein [unclassified Salinivibrio]|uniref:glycine betaine ABC transporter substrate-binding protein n=1 Tax=unclassified Salinivibrio TaxID=2636825 RepID=UPI00098698D9|nr:MULTISPECIES: glycine betaine ABC transporter substrate-binding protein [unclassified Salinivibrio]OOE92501.1 ABC transporter substrate-binding protein [Salinivibrio sp. AR647]OOE95244.1 ABC transporter substrate-binding protein [Salinivibrio sp. AR640]OOF02109.1 ABC transporter substrate-binding protein [Salinivibrio sp. MA440]
MITTPNRLLVSILFVCATTAQANENKACGDVSIADMNWNSATLMAHVDQFILEHGYGCNASLVPGDTMPTGVSMTEKGEPDIAPEFWTNSHKAMLDKGVNEGRLRYAGDAFSQGGNEGFWVPKYMVDKHPELATIEGIKAQRDLFPHPEDPDKAAFMGCPAGWTCQISAEHIFNALELDKAGFEIVDPGSAAGLAGTIARANERQNPWFGYYWAPTPVMGKYEMVEVDLGADVDLEHYKQCITQADCQSPKVTAFPVSPVHSLTTASFAEQAPAAFNYINRREYDNQVMSDMLAWMDTYQADGEIAADEFLRRYRTEWHQWVDEKTAQRIEDALQ